MNEFYNNPPHQSESKGSEIDQLVTLIGQLENSSLGLLASMLPALAAAETVVDSATSSQISMTVGPSVEEAEPTAPTSPSTPGDDLTQTTDSLTRLLERFGLIGDENSKLAGEITKNEGLKNVFSNLIDLELNRSNEQTTLLTRVASELGLSIDSNGEVSISIEKRSTIDASRAAVLSNAICEQLVRGLVTQCAENGVSATDSFNIIEGLMAPAMAIAQSIPNEREEIRNAFIGSIDRFVTREYIESIVNAAVSGIDWGKTSSGGVPHQNPNSEGNY